MRIHTIEVLMSVDPNSQPRVTLQLRRAYFALNRRLERLLAKHEVSADQYRVLLMLKLHGSCTQAELGETLLSDPSTIGAMVRLLEKRGMIERSVDPNDSRARRLAFTATGERLYKRVAPVAAGIRAELNELLSVSERETLLRALKKIESHFLDERK
jgi:DNA-binding MarR family transcriptional regulator